MLSYYNRKKLCPMFRISVLRAGKGLVRGGSVYVYMREMTGYDFRQKKGCGKIGLYHSLLGTAYSFMGFRSLSSQMRMVAACAPVISAISSGCIPLRSRAMATSLWISVFPSTFPSALPSILPSATPSLINSSSSLHMLSAPFCVSFNSRTRSASTLLYMSSAFLQYRSCIRWPNSVSSCFDEFTYMIWS